jgi:hypothetical protein
MSGADSDEDRADELTERYRAASAEDRDRPGDSVRQSILAHARTVAADHAARGVASARTRRPAANDSGWPIAAAASVIVAGFASVLAWHFHAPTQLPMQGPDPVPSNIVANNQSAAGSTVSRQPSEPLVTDRRASAPLAPNSVTTRSGKRTVTRAETTAPAHDAAADLGMDGETSSRQAPARVAGAPAAENAAAGNSAIDTKGGPVNPAVTAQVAPSAATPPPDLEARRSPAPSGGASARASAAPNSLLITAAESGDLERVDQLLRSGVSTEQTDARGRTALLVATLRADTPMVRRLLAAGARADVVDEEGDTPLAAARRQGPPELARLLERATQP